ncbi:MAG: DUF1295 domain-containing protein [Clostridiales bacterium]|nr:DUF1295 domain-containing protein [Clostridiales bacterium]MCF8023098.1 DUF1295 domain-containing protein [Clostridiales bacterium]
MKYVLLIVLWASFCIIHSVLASTGVTSWIENKFGQYYAFYRLAYNFVALATFFPLLIYTKGMDSIQVINIPYPWNLVPTLLLALSAVILVITILQYDILEFAGIRQVINFFSNSSSYSSRVVTTGLLRIVRHPAYLSVIILAWAQSNSLAEILASIVLTLYIMIGILREENKLAAQYGRLYIEYQQQVPMLIPFLRKRRKD